MDYAESTGHVQIQRSCAGGSAFRMNWREQAAALGLYRTIAVTDGILLAGIVRAHHGGDQGCGYPFYPGLPADKRP